MQKEKEKKQKQIISFLLSLCLVLTAATAYFAFREGEARHREQLVNERAVSSLCESLDSISVSLKKSLYSLDGHALSELGNELCRQTAVAKESLSLISPEGEEADEIYKFLSQVGDYTLFLSGKAQRTQRQKDDLEKLSVYAGQLSRGINEICLDYYNGELSFDSAVRLLTGELPSPETGLHSRLLDTAQSLTAYPTLIYDGPFSDNLSKGRGKMLEGENEVTAEEAAQRVSELLGIDKTSLRQQENVKGEIELYSFSKGKTDITVTKKGGYLCTVLGEVYALEQELSPEEAVKRAETYLEKLGYKGMKSTYYSIYDGICTVNLAYEDKGIICYGDLIKAGISLDKGKLVSLDATTYLLSHREREGAREAVSSERAEALIPRELEIKSCRLAYIPLDTGKEALCYELHCADGKKQEVLIYLDARTLEQRDTLLLLYSDGGILTK